MDRVSFILPKVLRQRGLDQYAAAGSVLERASAWIAQEMPIHAKSLQPVRVQDSQLQIEASNQIALT